MKLFKRKHAQPKAKIIPIKKEEEKKTKIKKITKTKKRHIKNKELRAVRGLLKRIYPDFIILLAVGCGAYSLLLLLLCFM